MILMAITLSVSILKAIRLVKEVVKVPLLYIHYICFTEQTSLGNSTIL